MIRFASMTILSICLLFNPYTASANTLKGMEIQCGSTNVYFGSDYLYYSTPGYHGNGQSKKSILDGGILDQYQYKVPYKNKSILIRNDGCDSGKVFCQREHIRAFTKSDSTYVIHTKKVEFYATPTKDPGLHPAILKTLRSKQISVRKGYSGTLEIEQKFTIDKVSNSFEYKDNEERFYSNDLWDGIKGLANINCSYR